MKDNIFYFKQIVTVSDEMPTPKIPKLKIRFGSNSNGINASPSGIVSATSPIILTSALSSVQP